MSGLQSQDEMLLEVKDLKKHFPIRGGWRARRSKLFVKAVDGLDLYIDEGETLGL